MVTESSPEVNHFFVSNVPLLPSCSNLEGKGGCIDEPRGYPVVFWEERNEIILFEPSIPEVEDYDDLKHSRRRWKYGIDTQLDRFPGSSYQLTESTWNEMKNNAKIGDSFVLERSKIKSFTSECIRPRAISGKDTSREGALGEGRTEEPRVAVLNQQSLSQEREIASSKEAAQKDFRVPSEAKHSEPKHRAEENNSPMPRQESKPPTQAVESGSEFRCLSSLSVQEQKGIVPLVEKYYEKMNTLQGRFVQSSYAVGLNQREVSKGKVSFKKPGLMDYRYEEPEKSKQRFVADGKYFWFYQPQNSLVTIDNFEQAFSSDLPISFLFGIGKLSDRFRLASACHTNAGVALKLVPRAQKTNLDEFALLVANDTNALRGARMVDAGGNETSIVFFDVQYNVAVDEVNFRFTVPSGVDVIDRRKMP